MRDAVLDQGAVVLHWVLLKKQNIIKTMYPITVKYLAQACKFVPLMEEKSPSAAYVGTEMKSICHIRPAGCQRSVGDGVEVD